jgi:hypothetical protein
MGDGMTYWQRLARWIANHLPRRVVYFALVRAEYEAREVQCPRTTEDLTFSQMCSLLHVILRDGLRIQAR